MQAAILRARLPRLAAWTERRRTLAARYRRQLTGSAVDVPPQCDPGHVYHLFVVRDDRRDDVQAQVAARGIETLIHYPVPIPRQPALAALDPAECPVATRTCNGILSLPLHPALRDEEVDEVAAAVHALEPRTRAS
jgi:dTDP-4-amino-4,6-dideoxygalactose transaminase